MSFCSIAGRFGAGLGKCTSRRPECRISCLALSLPEQKRVCEHFGAEFLDAPQDLKVGISLTAKAGHFPINGLRHPPEKDTTGWYIWGGEEFSDDPGFFEPLCVRHLQDWCPNVLPYLGLAPGWRILIACDYEDVWFDETLLAPPR